MPVALPCAPNPFMESRRIRRTAGQHQPAARRSTNCTRGPFPRSPTSSRARAISRLCSQANVGSSKVLSSSNSSRPMLSESTARSSGTSASSSGNDLEIDRELRADRSIDGPGNDDEGDVSGERGRPHRRGGHPQVERRELSRLQREDRKSTRLNSSHRTISYAVFCLKKKKKKKHQHKHTNTQY